MVISINTAAFKIHSGENMGKVKLIIGLIVLLVGLAFAAAPDAVGSYLNFSMDNIILQVIGIVIAIVGLVIMVKGRH